MFPIRRTLIYLWHSWLQQPIMGAIPRFVEPVLLVQRLLAEEGEQQDAPTVHGQARLIRQIGRRKAPVPVMIIVHCQYDLLGVANAHADLPLTKAHGVPDKGAG